MTLSKAQQEAWDKIKNFKTLTPDIAYQSDVFSPAEDWTDTVSISGQRGYTWYANRVYGKFNTATLKALEKKGLIKVHEFGGAHYSDTIEILEKRQCKICETKFVKGEWCKCFKVIKSIDDCNPEEVPYPDVKEGM